MRNDLKELVKTNNLDSIKIYCAGQDRKKFIEFLTLKNNLFDQSNPEMGVSALYIAANNQHSELTAFLVQKALEDIAGKKALAACLLAKNKEGRNLLHTAAFTPKNNINIKIICTAVKQLAEEKFPQLKDYLNIPDEMFGSTPLHIAARQTNLENYISLVAAGADEKLKSKSTPPGNGFIPIELTKYQTPDKSIPFVLALIKQSNVVNSYFRQRHGQIEHLPEHILKAIIQIDLDASLTNVSPAQLSAYNECMRLLTEVAHTEEEYNAILSNITLMNLSIIDEYELQQEMKKTPSDSLQVLNDILKKAAIIDDKDQAIKNAFLHAEIFRTLKNVPNINKEAFEQYSRLIEKYPELAVSGYQQIELSQNINPFIFARRYLIALAKSKINDLKNHPSKKSSLRFLRNTVDQPAVDTLQEFMNGLNNNYTTVRELDDLVDRLGNSSLNEVKTSMVEALNNIKLRTSQNLRTSQTLKSGMLT